MKPFAWAVAEDIGQAAAGATQTVADAMCGRGAGGTLQILKAGGIDVLDLARQSLVAPAALVSLAGIPGLGSIEEFPDASLRIGAMASLAQVAAHPLLQRRYPALTDAVGGSASPQIRHVATLGGNLLQRPRCWYFRAEQFHCLRKGGGHCFAIGGENQYHAIFDNAGCAIVHPSTAATVLVALQAEVELVDALSRTRRLPLEDFLLGPGCDVQRENDLRPHEVLTCVTLPPLDPGTRMAHMKVSQKESFDWPLADVAVVLQLADGGACRQARIVLGAAAPTPHRARSAEQMLQGRTLSKSLRRDAAHAALEGATPLSGNAYKLALFDALVQRALALALGRSAA